MVRATRADQPAAADSVTFAATPQEVATAEASAHVLTILGLVITPFSARTLAVRRAHGTGTGRRHRTRAQCAG